MSKTRKILSLVLAVVLVFALSVPAFANWEADENDYAQTWKLGAPVAVEGKTDVYTIDVSLTTNYPTGAVEFVLELTGDVTIVPKDQGAIVIGKDYYQNSDIDINPTSGKVVIVPNTNDPAALTAKPIDGVIATVTVTGTHGTITIKEDAKSEENQGGTLIATRLAPASLVGSTQYVGAATVDVTAATASIGVVPADLALKAGAQVGIVIDKNKTFGGAYDGAIYGFIKTTNTVFRTATYLTSNLEATNNGSLDFAASTGTVYGTGTVITVKNSDETVSKKYVVIIFGDVNGDAMINQNDAPTAKKNLVSWNKTNTIQNFAANCQAQAAALVLYQLNQNDLAAIKLYAGNKANKFSETDLAAKQLANTTYYK